jgi:small GTP-binding protein
MPHEYSHNISCPKAEPTSKRFKLVVLGESSTGKTSLTIRFVKKEFVFAEPTIGAGYLVGKTKLGTEFACWDTAGSERYRSLASMYFRNARCAIVAYDVAR